MALSCLLFPHSAPLAEVSTPRNTPFVGDAWVLLPAETDDIDSAHQRYAVGVNLRQTGSGTVRAFVVTSHDGHKWGIAGASGYLDADKAESYDIIEPTRLLRFVAVVTELGGTPSPSHFLSASLLSNGRFKLTRSPATVRLAVSLDVPVCVSRKAGRATLAAGRSEVDVVFQNPWPDALYAVVATSEGEPVTCWVTNRVATGFRLRVSAPVAQDTLVHWMAMHD